LPHDRRRPQAIGREQDGTAAPDVLAAPPGIFAGTIGFVDELAAAYDEDGMHIHLRRVVERNVERTQERRIQPGFFG
jgi:hypothetical protein